MKGKVRLLAFGLLALFLTGACEAFPTSMQDDPEAMEPIGDMQQSITVDEPPASELQQRIVFQQGPIRPEIYTMGTTGNDPRRLTTNVQADREPSWSFDAKKIVYRCHVLTFCMSNPDGTGAEQVYTHSDPPATDIGDPKLSPDGRSIAFDAEIFRGGMESTRGEILIVDLATKRITNVSNTPTQEDDDPEWHPTGGLMWSRAGVLVYDGDAAPGGEVLALTPASVRVTQPDVSPSGNRVAYVGRLAGDNQTDVYYFDLANATADDVKVTFTPFDDLAPSWSPNGRKLAVASKDQASDQDLEIFVVDTEPPGGGTATRRRLTFNDTDETEPDWATPQVTASVQQRLALAEGNPAAGQTTGTTAFGFAVFLSAPAAPGEQVEVRVATLAGSASTGNDYTAVDQTITFDAGEQTKTFTVPVVADTVAETNESFSIKIMEVTNALVGNAEGRAIITNDDVPPTPTPSPTPSATPTPQPGQPGGQIAYTSGVDGDYDVWVMDGAGTGKTNLTSDPSSEGSPDLSPDGRTVAFHRTVGAPSPGNPPNFDIYQVPSAGGAATRVNGVPDAFDVTPAWSPNGSAIAWVSSTSGGNPDVYSATPPTGTPAKLLETADDEAYVEWGRLANGNEAIAYDVQVPGPTDPTWNVKLAELPSKTIRSFGPGRHPEISPDGRKLVYASNVSGGDYEIYVLELATNSAIPTPLTSNAVDDFTPSWSPDGTKIAWTSHPNGGRADVFTMNANGSGQVNLTNSPGIDDFEPSWGVKPAATSPREQGATAALLVMLPLIGLASAAATRKRTP